MKKIFVERIMLFLALSFLVQCGKPTATPEKPEEPQPGSNSPNMNSPEPAQGQGSGGVGKESPGSWTFRGLVVPEKEPNHYVVQLKWNARSQTSPLTISKQEVATGRTTELVTLPSDSDFWSDLQVEPGKKYIYMLKTDKANEQLTLSIPHDLEFRSNTTVTESLNANRLFFFNGAQLFIEDRQITIFVNEIVSENGLIASFPVNSRAVLNANGRNGGVLRLQAERLTGKLNIVMRGEHGGSGIPGNSGNKGGPGLSGVDVTYICKLLEGPESVLKGIIVPRDPLDYCRQFERQGVPASQLYRCGVPPTNGMQGGPGSAGGNGGQGRNGGNSGSAYIQIKQALRQDLTVVLQAGEVGPGGAPGKGGAGGDGGWPGLEPHGLCSAQVGPMGPAGADGHPGVEGNLGKKGSLCLIGKGFAEGDCP